MISPSDLVNSDESDFGEGDFFCAEGIVARNDDPEHCGRVQCVIPTFDENEIHEVWARRICLFVGAPGYSDFHLPEIGASVMLMGRFGDTHNLFYAAITTEERPVPSDFRTPAKRGLRNDGDYAIITEGDLILRGGRIIIQADTSVKIIAPAGVFNLTGSEG